MRETHDIRPWEFAKPDGSVGVCSWCERDHGHSPSPTDSHGICPAHLAEMRQELAQRRAAAVFFHPIKT